MVDYFNLVRDELLNKLAQTKQFVKKHNPTIGALTEEILRSFLKTYLPKCVSVEQGFIMGIDGTLSKQCDILIYDSHNYAPFYRINDIVIIHPASVIAVIEVKTTIQKNIFFDTIDYFANISAHTNARKFLFIYKSRSIENISNYLLSYNKGGKQVTFDHDTFQLLPDEIVGIDKSYHLKKDYVSFERDSMGYSSYFYENKQGTEISALQTFYLSIYELVENHSKKKESLHKKDWLNLENLKSISAIELFDV